MSSLTLVHSQTLEDKNAPKKYSVGVSVINNYDLYRSGTLVTPLGYHLGDMKGMSGEKTGIDLSYGLDFTYAFNSVLSIDFNYSLGSLRGATEDDILYYESGINTYGVALNLGLFSSNSGKRKLIPYFRGGFGNLRYNTTVKFVASDLALNRLNPSESGSASTWLLGAGFKYHLNDRMNLFVQVEHTSIATDKVDGNDFGNTDNSILRSSIGFRYTFGGKSSSGKTSDGNEASQAGAHNSGASNYSLEVTPVATTK
jgi:opacity protein-like surface antigen